MKSSSVNKTPKNKYAFNLKQMKENQKKGVYIPDLYDEIEKEEMKLRSNKNSLTKIKDDSFKEFIYTNRSIPKNWKNKLDYQAQILKLLSNDSDFLLYVGHHNNENEINNNRPKTSRNIPISRNRIILPKKLLNINTNIEDNIIKKSPLTERNLNINKNKLKFYKKELTEKEISNILDEYKVSFPIREKLKDLYSEEELNAVNFYQNNTEIKRPDFYPGIKSVKRRVKDHNIYINFIPSSENVEPVKRNFSSIRRKEECKTKIGKNNFDKKLQITNPKILKYLEGINFYGPYYSYCPTCKNKNYDFYNNLEVNQCIQLVHQVKKQRGQNKFNINNKKSSEINKIDKCKIKELIL